mmetsp:Transcript_17209/g.37550  ORF Transcript_17209/g.37550 Transcript_17209/m.37550 type:complete len:156 (+) Transcript_17209:74-541(+)
MNTIQPSSPRRMKQSKPTSHVRPDEFLPIRTTAEGSPRRSIGSGKQRSTSLLDSLRMKLEHEKSGDSDKILNGIRTRLETTPNHKSSAAGEQQQQQQQRRRIAHPQYTPITTRSRGDPTATTTRSSFSRSSTNPDDHAPSSSFTTNDGSFTTHGP